MMQDFYKSIGQVLEPLDDPPAKTAEQLEVEAYWRQVAADYEAREEERKADDE